MKKLADRHTAVDTKRFMTDSAMVYDFPLDKEFQRKQETANHSREWVKPEMSIFTRTAKTRPHRFIPSGEHKASASLFGGVLRVDSTCGTMQTGSSRLCGGC
jgi:hypothetical protein